MGLQLEELLGYYIKNGNPRQIEEMREKIKSLTLSSKSV
jgi:hypothetical protein